MDLNKSVSSVYTAKFCLDAIHSPHISRIIKIISKSNCYYSSCQTCLWSYYWPCSWIFLFWQVSLHSVHSCKSNIWEFLLVAKWCNCNL